MFYTFTSVGCVVRLRRSHTLCAAVLYTYTHIFHIYIYSTLYVCWCRGLKLGSNVGGVLRVVDVVDVRVVSL